MCVCVCACATYAWQIENKPEITVETERKRENFGIRSEIRVLRNFLWDLIFHDEAMLTRAAHLFERVFFAQHYVKCARRLCCRTALSFSIFRFQYFFQIQV